MIFIDAAITQNILQSCTAYGTHQRDKKFSLTDVLDSLIQIFQMSLVIFHTRPTLVSRPRVYPEHGRLDLWTSRCL